MSLAKLSDNERKIIFECLNAISKGNFLEHEHHARLGIDLEELKQIVAAYPNIDDSDDNSNEVLAINNCLNEVCHGISFSDREWSEWFTFNKSEAYDIYRKWAILRGWSNTGIR